MTADEFKTLIDEGEADRVERTISTTDTNKFREAICAFSNDLPGYGKPGYLLIGVNDNGTPSGLVATDDLLKQFASYRDDGQILPQPRINVAHQSHPAGGGDVIVVEVHPHSLPPVRFRGRTHVRVGPRKGTASEAEERVLAERRASKFPTFDVTPCPEGDLQRLDLETFRQTYRSQAIAPEVIAENHREVKEQLSALRFYNLKQDCPTNAGMLVFAYDPLDLFPGAKVQFVQYDGPELADEVLAEKMFTGNLITLLAELDSFLKGRFIQKPVTVSDLREQAV